MILHRLSSAVPVVAEREWAGRFTPRAQPSRFPVVPFRATSRRAATAAMAARIRTAAPMVAMGVSPIRALLADLNKMAVPVATVVAAAAAGSMQVEGGAVSGAAAAAPAGPQAVIV